MNIPDDKLLSLIQSHRTPFFLYDGDALRAHVGSILERLHPAVKLHYALKANANVTIAALLSSLGCGVEIASAGELFIALKAGYKAEDIIFAGPGKTESELSEAIEAGIGCFNVESIRELRLLEKVAVRSGVRVRAAVRINPDADLSGATIKMGGTARPFGVDEAQLDVFFAAQQECGHIQFQGIQVYTGTQMLKAEDIIGSFENTVRLAGEISLKYGLPVHSINLGGGFGIPYFTHEQPLDMERVLQHLNGLVEEATQRMAGVRFIIESGRYLVAQAGMYVTKVLYTKISKGEKFVVTDGGMNHYASAAFRGRRLRDNYPVKVLGGNKLHSEMPSTAEHSLRQTLREEVTVVGPLCTPEDCLVRKAKLPVIMENDYICIPNAGAYGLSYSPVDFLGHPAPAELLAAGGQLYVIREHGNRTDALRHQRLIQPELLQEI
ncbi:type III PLP-dependent enzyme [Paenibacillus sp. P96]|uniref:Type III PLP-dependent enzyme n=1 Tax=Paenibacillus zeirhizosphaerae TaxID=2987519 RepID=A0ABT9FLV5_9BACL|nr:type III PLP-dependent enzyme [Paenibacillus sp. P96]MDP4095710.1 type III PLP-dependent enzyme [Paenibacillus sp. P96]